MRFTRLVTGAIAAALVGSVTAAIPAPAQAGLPSSWPTTTTARPSDGAIIYGDTISISGKVSTGDATGDETLSGTVTLWAARASAGSDREYKPIDSQTTSGSYTFSGVQPRRNTFYGVAFTDDAADATSYDSSQSDAYKVGVARDVDTRNPRGLKVVGKIRPAYKHKKVIVQRKKGKRWARYQVVRTNRRSKFAVTLKAPARRGASFRYRITVPGNKDYLTYRELWTATTSRPMTRVSIGS